MITDAVVSGREDPLGKHEMNDDTSSPKDVVDALNLTNVLLSCHHLFADFSMTKLTITMFIMTICTMYGVNNLFVNELLYFLPK